MCNLRALIVAVTIATAGAATSLTSQRCLDQTSPGFLNRVRLDATRNAYLLQIAQSRGNTLYAIKYDGNSSCPVILDSVRASQGLSAFEYDCGIAGHKGAAAVALTKRDQNGKRLAVLKAWLIDPRSLHFVPARGNVMCSDEGFSGEDSGGDLLSRARMR
jgi:hypothetical protein